MFYGKNITFHAKRFAEFRALNLDQTFQELLSFSFKSKKLFTSNNQNQALLVKCISTKRFTNFDELK